MEQTPIRRTGSSIIRSLAGHAKRSPWGQRVSALAVGLACLALSASLVESNGLQKLDLSQAESPTRDTRSTLLPSGNTGAEAALQAQDTLREPPAHRVAGGRSLNTTTLTLDGRNVEVRSDAVLVRPADAALASAVLDRMGARILRKSPSGAWRVAVPDGQSVDAFLARLERQEEFQSVRPEGVVRATSLADGTATYRSIQWNLDQVGWDHELYGDDQDAIDLAALASVQIAIIDSGVAYETRTANGVTYSASPDLAGSAIIAGTDWVDNDGHPNDESGHGTHLANIMAANGGTFGIAPGVTLQVQRVLDASNAGSELDLADAITAAADAGADVINLSLSFPVGFVPGQEVASAVQHATDLGALVVASSGNSSSEEVGYPAAYAAALSVGASRLTVGRMDWVADYSNVGTGLDLIAPGGDNSLDVNGDGKSDGIPAQTLEPGNPSVLHYYLMSGTSQAAAHVSAAAAVLISRGADAALARQALINTSVGVWGKKQFWNRLGLGVMNLPKALEAVENGGDASTEARQYYVDLLPLQFDYNGSKAALGMIKVIDDRGLPAKQVMVAGHWFGSSNAVFSVITNNMGSALIATSATATSTQGSFFGLQVDRVIDRKNRVAPAPVGFYYMSTGYLAALNKWESNPVTAGASLLLRADNTTPNLPSFISSQLIHRPLGTVESFVPIAMTIDDAFLSAILASQGTVTTEVASFTTPKTFGWGTSSSVSMEVHSGATLINGLTLKLGIAKYDPAMFYGNLCVTAPVLNVSASSWETATVAYNAGLASSAIGAGKFESVFSQSLAWELYGDSLAWELYGDSLAWELYGDSLAWELYGDSLVSSVIASAVMGELYGDSLAWELYGDSLAWELYGDTLAWELYGDSVSGVVISATPSNTTTGQSVQVELLGSSVTAPMLVAASVSYANAIAVVPVEVVSALNTTDTVVITPDE